jgi:hypothetical protein
MLIPYIKNYDYFLKIFVSVRFMFAGIQRVTNV